MSLRKQADDLIDAAFTNYEQYAEDKDEGFGVADTMDWEPTATEADEGMVTALSQRITDSLKQAITISLRARTDSQTYQSLPLVASLPDDLFEHSDKISEDEVHESRAFLDLMAGEHLQPLSSYNYILGKVNNRDVAMRVAKEIKTTIEPALNVRNGMGAAKFYRWMKTMEEDRASKYAYRCGDKTPAGTSSREKLMAVGRKDILSDKDKRGLHMVFKQDLKDGRADYDDTFYRNLFAMSGVPDLKHIHIRRKPESYRSHLYNPRSYKFPVAFGDIFMGEGFQITGVDNFPG